jgi:Protein of unknown function (DUF2946)
LLDNSSDKLFFMGLSRKTRCFAAWIACFAILLASLAPSISQTLAAAGSTTAFQAKDSLMHAEMYGAAHHDHDGHGAPSSIPKASHLEHCPFCLTHAGSFALLQSVPATLHEVGGFCEFPLLFFQAPRLFYVWVSARIRAPPAVS